MPNKKITLSISGLLAIIATIMGTAEPFRLCGSIWRECMDINYNFDIILLPIVPFFFFAFITYFMREEVYKAWIRFALWWLGISIVLILITPEPQTGSFGPQILFGKGDVALLTCVLFIIISLAIILIKYFRPSRIR